MKKLLTLALALTLSLAACGTTTPPATSPANTEPSSQSAAEPSSAAPTSTAEDNGNDYKLEIKLLDDKKAAVVIGDAAPTSEMVGTHWGVELDNKYAVRLDVEDGFFDCASWKFAEDMSSSRLSNMKFTIADDALILYADLGSEADFCFADVKEVTLVVDDVADKEFRYDPVTLAMADITVSEITLTTADIEMPSTAKSSEASAEVTDTPATTMPAVSGSASDADAFVGEYMGNNTDSKIVISKSGDKLITEIMIDTADLDGKPGPYESSKTQPFAASDIKDIGSNIYQVETTTEDGRKCQLSFNSMTDPTGVSIILDGSGFPASRASSAPKTVSNFAAMAGTYQGGWTTLTISTDGSFTYADTKISETLSGKLPDGAKSGVTLTLGSYTVKFNFSEDFKTFSTDIKDASGRLVSGDDMSRQ